MDDTRITVRLSAGDLQVIDALVGTGEFRDRSELIRRAIKDFLNSRAEDVLKSIRAKQAIVAEAQAIASAQAAADAQKDAITRLTRQ